MQKETQKEVVLALAIIKKVKQTKVTPKCMLIWMALPFETYFKLFLSFFFFPFNVTFNLHLKGSLPFC